MPESAGYGFRAGADSISARFTPRADMESAPTGAQYNAKLRFFDATGMFPAFRRAGVHARRTVEIPGNIPAGPLRRREHPREG